LTEKVRQLPCQNHDQDAAKQRCTGKHRERRTYDAIALLGIPQFLGVSNEAGYSRLDSEVQISDIQRQLQQKRPCTKNIFRKGANQKGGKK